MSALFFYSVTASLQYCLDITLFKWLPGCNTNSCSLPDLQQHLVASLSFTVAACITVKYITLGKDTYMLCNMRLLLVVTNQEVCQRLSNLSWPSVALSGFIIIYSCSLHNSKIHNFRQRDTYMLCNMCLLLVVTNQEVCQRLSNLTWPSAALKEWLHYHLQLHMNDSKIHNFRQRGLHLVWHAPSADSGKPGSVPKASQQGHMYRICSAQLT